MVIQSFVFNKNQVNTYIVSDEVTKEAMIIDCGCTSNEEFNKICVFRRYPFTNSDDIRSL